MIHFLVNDWTKPGEAVTSFDVVELKAYRIKDKDGKYRIVLSDHKPRMSGNPGHLVSEPVPEYHPQGEEGPLPKIDAEEEAPYTG